MGPIAKAQDFGGTIRRLGGLLGPERTRLMMMGGLALAAVTLAVIGPRLLGDATNVVVEGLFGTGVDFGRLGGILGVVLAIYLGSFLCGWLQNRAMTLAVQARMRHLRDEVEAKLHRVPLSYLDAQPRGEILSRVTNDIDNVAASMTQVLMQLITSVLMIVGVLVMMFTISWLLALVSLLTVPVAGLLTLRIAKRSQPHFKKQWAATGTLNAHVEEMFTGHALVKAFGQQSEARAAFVAENQDLFEAARKAQYLSGTIAPVMGFVANLNYVAIAVLGGLRIVSGQMTIGGVQAFIQYSRQFTQPITQVAAIMNVLQSAVASAERVFEVLDAPEQSPDQADAATLAEVRGRVTFERVQFSYDPDEPLITDLNLVVEPGQTVAIVGPTGAGKTTLVNLLMRFYEVAGGRITLDGVDTRELTRDALRSSVGMVLQDTWLFKGTIEENLRYGAREGLTEAEFYAATRATHVDPIVRTLPDGYQTMLDDEAAGLSVGERQLFTIARAFLADPQILVLDEATSSVDTRTEVLVQQAMGALRVGRTSFIIAHRLSTIRDADVIVVMEHGNIVETGTHQRLLAASGSYARLHQAQFEAAGSKVESRFCDSLALAE